MTLCGVDCATEREMAAAHIADLRAEVERLRTIVASLVEEEAAIPTGQNVWSEHRLSPGWGACK